MQNKLTKYNFVKVAFFYHVLSVELTCPKVQNNNTHLAFPLNYNLLCMPGKNVVQQAFFLNFQKGKHAQHAHNTPMNKLQTF